MRATTTTRPLPDLRTRAQIEDEASRLTGNPRTYAITCWHSSWSIASESCRGGDHCKALQNKLDELRTAWRRAVR